MDEVLRSGGVQSAYLALMEWFLQHGMTQRGVFTSMLTAIHFVAYYLHGLIFTFADYYGFFDKWSIRDGRHRYPKESLRWESLKHATRDALLMKPVILYLVYPLASQYISFKTLPELQSAFFQWLGMMCIFSTSLFWLHGAMHYFPAIHKRVHKQHHTFHETVAFAAQYAHPIEDLASAFHVVLSIVIIQPHFLVFCFFMWTTFVEIIDSHLWL